LKTFSSVSITHGAGIGAAIDLGIKAGLGIEASNLIEPSKGGIKGRQGPMDWTRFDPTGTPPIGESCSCKVLPVARENCLLPNMGFDNAGVG